MARSYTLLLYWLAGAALAAATDAARPVTPVFEQEARELLAGRSPKFLIRAAHGLQMIFVKPAEGGRGQDIYFQASTDLGDNFEEPIRVNDVPGEVVDHGENSPLFLASPDNRYLYVVWNARDPKNPTGSVVRFSRAMAMRPSFSPALTVNDDGLPVSHSFQSAAVAPDGTIYVGWLDGRDRDAQAGHGSHGSGGGSNTAIYVARSTDNGQTFSKNVRVAGDICPCCRLTFAFAGGKVLIGWRQVEPGDVRDIFVAASADKGDTWEKPALVARDGWKINGCPHVGPALALLGSKLYAAWFTEGSGDPAINLAYSTDGGKTFSPKKKVSGATVDPTHPQLVSNGEKLALIFQARSPNQDKGWGRVAVYYREIFPDGSMSELVRLPEGKANANYPSATFGLSGRIFVGWTESVKGTSSVYLLRGRSVVSKGASD